MMVTFVSQCEKKALNRTRRVLDSFANRIGDNTWQTVITNEGLGAVKKLLRKTASKNTAVSCFWIRSRSRSELVWIVGKRDKFNSEGVVPVNYTNQDKFIGEITMEKIYANTKKQPLDQHLFAVGLVSKTLMQKIAPVEKLPKQAFIAGCWHDVGKLDPSFQDWLDKEINKKNPNLIVPEEGVHNDTQSGRFSWQKHPRHNEVSTLLHHLLADVTNFDNLEKDIIKHAIFWHHAKPIRKDEFKTLSIIFDKLKNNLENYQLLFANTRALINQVNQLNENYFSENANLIALKTLDIPTGDFEYDLENTPHPKYKTYNSKTQITDYSKQITINAKNNLIRTAVVTADRLVSSLNSDELQEHINNRSLESLLDEALSKDRNLKSHIKTCLDGFDKKYPNSQRNKEQADTAKYLADEEVKIGVLRGPAGCGKTKIALEWANKTNAKKILWICPRVQICQSLFKDLTSEYLPDAKIEIYTGEYKQIHQSGKIADNSDNKPFSGDIVITTIDQMVNSITTHRQIDILAIYMDSHAVFDEFHEYVNMSGLNMLFAELIKCKQLQQNNNKLPNTLLVSATPHYLFVQDFLGIDKDDIKGIDSFNSRPYKIEFADYCENLENETNPLYQKQETNTFVISNTATTAQKSFINNQENTILTHAKFKTTDKQLIFDKVINTFKQDGSKDKVLRAGPIIQSSLNISGKKMIGEMTCAENFLQRMGRLNRFAEHDNATYTIAITEGVKKGKQSGNSAKFLGRMYILQSAKVWFEFLDDKLKDDQTVTINELYKWYQEFYDSDNQLIKQDLEVSLKESVKNINNNIYDPLEIPKKQNKENVKIKKYSLRGNNRFVQMAVWNISNGKEEFPDEYAYEENDAKDSLTMPVGPICGYGDSNQDLLAFMAKKHHNIKDDARKPYNNNVLLNAARTPETPIYLSYTPEDLKKVEAQSHPYAIYYAIGKTQPIGAISINKLKGE